MPDPVTPPVVPAVETPPPTPPTEEQLAADIAEFKATFLTGDDVQTRQKKAKIAKAKAEAPPEEETVVVEEPPKEETPPVTPPAPPTPPEPLKRIVVPPPPTSLEEGDKDEEALANRIAERLKPKTAIIPLDVPLSVKEQRLIEVYQAMVEVDPKYKDLDKRFLAQRKREEAYIQKWEQENPGRDFAADDGEHDEVFKTAPNYDPEDFAMALDFVAEKRFQAKADKFIEGKLKERDQKSFAISERQAIAQAVNDTVGDLIQRAVPEFKDLITVNGQVLINNDAEQKMEELDPVALSVLREESEQMTAVVNELESVTRLGEAYKLDPNKTVRLKHKGIRFTPVQEMLELVSGLEQELLNLPPEQAARDGRRLISVQDYNNYQDKARSNPALLQRFKRDYYCLTVEDFRDGIIAQSVTNAKSRIEKLKKTPTKKETPAPQPVQQAPPTNGTPTLPPPIRKNGSTTVPSSDTVNTRQPVVDDEAENLKIILATRAKG